MRNLLLLAIVFVGSCDNSSLDVQLTIPDIYQDQVRSVALSVIVPPQGAPFACEDIAFGLVTEEFVRANTVEEVRLSTGGNGALNSVPRRGTKLFWARGYDQSGEQIVAGCAETGDISGKQEIEISGEPVTIVVLPALSPTELPGRTTKVLVTDAMGTPTSDIEVRWTRTASGSEPETTEVVTDTAGQLAVVIGQLVYPGPVAVDLKAKWNRGDTPVLLGFRSPSSANTISDTLPNYLNVDTRDLTPKYETGRFGPSGQTGFAALTGENSDQKRQVFVRYYDNTISDFETVTSDPLPGGVNTIVALRETGRDRILGVGPMGIVEILPDGSLTPVATRDNTEVIRSIFPLADCEQPLTTQSFLLTTLSDNRSAIDSSGQDVSSPFAENSIAGKAIASGCLSISGKLRRTVVYSNGQVTTLLTIVDGLPRKTALGVIPSGVGFIEDDGESLLLATTLSVSGTDIVRFRISTVADSALSVEPITSDATPSFSLSTTAGDIDGDGLTDVASIVSVLGSGEDATYRIFISLGLQAASGRVAAVSGQLRGERPRLFLRDFDGDGHEDLLIGTAISYLLLLMGPDRE